MPAPLRRFDEQKLRELQADPMWTQTGALGVPPRPRHLVAMTAWWALTILAVDGQLERWEAYIRRLDALLDHGPRPMSPAR